MTRYRIAVIAVAATVAAGVSAIALGGEVTRGPGGDAVPLPASWREPPPTGAANSASRVIFWINCEDALRLSDADLALWKRRGAGGFACMTGYLRGVGGNENFTGAARASLNGPSYSYQRRLRDTRFAQRARRHGLKVYLGFYAANPAAGSRPLANWFDDRAWRSGVLPRVREFAAAARRLGFSGLAIDQELYHADASDWSWQATAAGHSETATRRAAKKRGAELMRAILDGYPNVDLLAYYTQVPESWEAHVQGVTNHNDDAFRENLQLNLWDGISSVPGYRRIRWLESIFYKTTHISGVSWQDAIRANATSVYAVLSREFSNWDYAASRLDVTPFAWIDAGQTQFESAQPPDKVAEQLRAFSDWGTGGEIGNFVIADLKSFDYRPYVGGLRAAAERRNVDAEPPRLTVTAPGPGPVIKVDGGTVNLAGEASDNFAVRAVRWRDDRGGEGIARLDAAGKPPGTVAWSIDPLPLTPGATAIYLRVEDIKQLASVTRLELVN